MTLVTEDDPNYMSQNQEWPMDPGPKDKAKPKKDDRVPIYTSIKDNNGRIKNQSD